MIILHHNIWTILQNLSMQINHWHKDFHGLCLLPLCLPFTCRPVEFGPELKTAEGRLVQLYYISRSKAFKKKTGSKSEMKLATMEIRLIAKVVKNITPTYVIIIVNAREINTKNIWNIWVWISLSLIKTNGGVCVRFLDDIYRL